jgi:hypothetical protein
MNVTRIEKVYVASETLDKSQETEQEPFAPASWPEPLAEPAFHGLAGEIVRAIEPHTEADLAALLIQFLVGFGNLVGRGPYTAVEADRHYANLFAALVGVTAKGRKGTAWGHVRRVLENIDPQWASGRIQGGLSSGEGLIWGVRDKIEKQEAIRKKGRVVGLPDNCRKSRRLRQEALGNRD